MRQLPRPARRLRGLAEDGACMAGGGGFVASVRPCLPVRSPGSGNLIGRDLALYPQTGERRGTWRHVRGRRSVLRGPDESGPLGQLTVARRRRDNPSLASRNHGRAPLAGLSDARRRLPNKTGYGSLSLAVSAVTTSYTNALLPALLAPFGRSLRTGTPRYRAGDKIRYPAISDTGPTAGSRRR